MRRQPGERVTRIQLPAIDGRSFDTDSLIGRPYMLSFFRFATCPFCNLRLHELVTRFTEFGSDFTIVAIFDSPLDHLTSQAAGHKAPFPILADERNQSYRAYNIEHSFVGMLKGMILRMPTLLKGMFMGYVPTTIKGSLTTMPADFLIDNRGIIRQVYYGRDEGDHLPFARVKEFSLCPDSV
ncbi:MAG: peroxiredoxin-like family protein [Nitrospirota bacterium]